MKLKIFFNELQIYTRKCNELLDGATEASYNHIVEILPPGSYTAWAGVVR